MIFRTTETAANAAYELVIRDNTFLRDNAACNTFLNGNRSYQVGAYAMHVNHNRVIGYGSLFPNVANWTLDINGDFNYNYFAPTYEGYHDILGTTSTYYGGNSLYVDPFDIANVIYYEDYAMTMYPGMLDVTGVSFNDDADVVNIDNTNGVITAIYTCGMDIVNPSLRLREAAAVAQFYRDAACTQAIDRISAPKENSTVTVYAKVTNGSRSKVFTVTLYGEETAPKFSESFTDPNGVISRSAYLLAPQTAGLSAGADFTASWGSVDYVFTVGTNAFSSLNDIFNAAGSSIPQILLLSQPYAALHVNRACEIYGENYATPAAQGSGLGHWDLGTAWGSRKSAQVAGISVTCPEVTVSGIELTGSFQDASRTAAGEITVKNALITATDEVLFQLSAPVLGSGMNTYSLSGLFFKGSGNTLLNGTLPTHLTVSGCYSDHALTKLCADGFGSASGTLRLTGNHFRFCGGDFLGALTAGSLQMQENAFVTELKEGESALRLAPAACNALSVRHNDFLGNGSGTAVTFDYLGAVSAAADFLGNRVMGFAADFGGAQTENLRHPVDVSGNFFADSERSINHSA